MIINVISQLKPGQHVTVFTKGGHVIRGHVVEAHAVDYKYVTINVGVTNSNALHLCTIDFLNIDAITTMNSNLS